MDFNEGNFSSPVSEDLQFQDASPITLDNIDAIGKETYENKEIPFKKEPQKIIFNRENENEDMSMELDDEMDLESLDESQYTEEYVDQEFPTYNNSNDARNRMKKLEENTANYHKLVDCFDDFSKINGKKSMSIKDVKKFFSSKLSFIK